MEIELEKSNVLILGPTGMAAILSCSSLVTFALCRYCHQCPRWICMLPSPNSASLPPLCASKASLALLLAAFVALWFVKTSF